MVAICSAHDQYPGQKIDDQFDDKWVIQPWRVYLAIFLPMAIFIILFVFLCSIFICLGFYYKKLRRERRQGIPLQYPVPPQEE